MEPRDIITQIGLPYSKVSQKLGVSIDTVKSWKCGRRNPNKKHLKALIILARKAK